MSEGIRTMVAVPDTLAVNKAPRAGDVFWSHGVQMYTSYSADDRGDPTIERWVFANDEDDPNHGYGHLKLTVLEIVPTVSSGTLAVYRKQWIAPDGEPLNAGRRVVGGLQSLKALISRRKMTGDAPHFDV